eukprot:COSAG02_NODE_984_length_15467_cov_20.165799_1_plen_149_part_00
MDAISRFVTTSNLTPRDSVLKRSRVAAGVAQPLRHPPPTPRLLPLRDSSPPLFHPFRHPRPSPSPHQHSRDSFTKPRDRDPDGQHFHYAPVCPPIYHTVCPNIKRRETLKSVTHRAGLLPGTCPRPFPYNLVEFQAESLEYLLAETGI